MTVYVRQVRDEDIIEMHVAHPQQPVRMIEVETPSYQPLAPKSSPSSWHTAAELGFVGFIVHFLG